MEDKIICNRCGKEIKDENDIIKLRQSDPFHGYEECYWCRFCYEMFMAELED